MVGLSRKRVFPKQKGTPSLVKIEHKNTATLDSARSKKNLKSQFCNYAAGSRWAYKRNKVHFHCLFEGKMLIVH